jgi:hypothetical protein
MSALDASICERGSAKRPSGATRFVPIDTFYARRTVNGWCIDYARIVRGSGGQQPRNLGRCPGKLSTCPPGNRRWPRLVRRPVAGRVVAKSNSERKGEAEAAPYAAGWTGLRPGPAPQSGFDLPLRASRRPSSVSAALPVAGLPLSLVRGRRMTHPNSVARAMVFRDSSIPSTAAHCMGCPSVESYSL